MWFTRLDELRSDPLGGLAGAHAAPHGVVGHGDPLGGAGLRAEDPAVVDRVGVEVERDSPAARDRADQVPSDVVVDERDAASGISDRASHLESALGPGTVVHLLELAVQHPHPTVLAGVVVDRVLPPDFPAQQQELVRLAAMEQVARVALGAPLRELPPVVLRARVVGQDPSHLRPSGVPWCGLPLESATEMVEGCGHGASGRRERIDGRTGERDVQRSVSPKPRTRGSSTRLGQGLDPASRGRVQNASRVVGTRPAAWIAQGDGRVLAPR